MKKYSYVYCRPARITLEVADKGIHGVDEELSLTRLARYTVLPRVPHVKIPPEKRTFVSHGRLKRRLEVNAHWDETGAGREFDQ